MANMTADQLRKLTKTIFEAAGTSSDVAEQVARSLVENNLMGHDSHGVIRVPDYARRVKSGEIKSSAKPEIVKETAVTAVVNGNWNFGQIVARDAMQVAIDKAKQSGIGAVGILHCNHIGRLGEYSAMAAEQGLIGLVVVNAIPAAAPFGGKARVLGTNPISFAVPAGKQPMLLVDFATTVVAEGKLRVARDKHEKVPSHYILDKDGNPSEDPNDFYNGGMLQFFGAHKGYALGVLVEALAGALAGAYTYEGNDRGNGVFMLAINPAGFDSAEGFRERIDALFSRIKAVPPAPGFKQVLIPGEPEMNNKKTRLAEGIYVPADTWEALKKVAAEFGVDADKVVA
ncbi:MAG: Ldh family oxidoreductase [Chloroflexi bacterium]|nr:Ldh family oxidoreductase [Chloroflexota bacterium]